MPFKESKDKEKIVFSKRAFEDAIIEIEYAELRGADLRIVKDLILTILKTSEKHLFQIK